jgi:hypothetical protein
MKKNLSLTHDDAAFLLVLLSEEPTIANRMRELQFPLDKVDLQGLVERVRRLCWDFHWDGKDNMGVEDDSKMELSFDASDSQLNGLFDVLVDLKAQGVINQEPSYELARRCLSEDVNLLTEAIKYGCSDTEVREALYKNIRQGKYPNIFPEIK